MARISEDKWEPLDSLGKSGETVANNIRRLRKERGILYTELADQLKTLGREIPTWGLRKIESGGRRVDVDDLLALAIVLGVSPASLLMPMRKGEDGAEEVQADDLVPITGWHKAITASAVWDWLIAADALIGGDADMLLSFYQRALPAWKREEVTKQYRAWRENFRKEAQKDMFNQLGWTDGNDR